MEAVEKALDPTEDWQFNQKHPRGFGGKFGPKPMQIQQQEEAQVPDTSGDPADSEVVDTGTNEQDAEVAVSKESAKRLKKSAEAVPHSQLVVVFESRADATKFAIAAEHALGSEAPLRVAAAANGTYHVEPTGLSAQAIDRIQSQIHAHVPLNEMNPEQETPGDAEEVAPAEPMGEAEIQADGPAANAQAVAEGWEETARELLAEAVRSGKVSKETLPDVMLMARALQGLSESRETGVLPVMEAVHYGTLAGLKEASESNDLEQAARARLIMDQIGLTKGVAMGQGQGQMLLLKVKPTEHDSMENDGKALPLGTNERVTDPAGESEKITEATAKYPKTGHKPARRPKLIMKRSAQVPIR